MRVPDGPSHPSHVHLSFAPADGTYTVSGARDHYRQQTVAGGFNVERAPHYPHMFSELPHYPATSFRSGSVAPKAACRGARSLFHQMLRRIMQLSEIGS